MFGWGSLSLRVKFTSGFGPDASSSGSMALRHHVPEKSGTGLVGAPIAGKTRIAVEMNPTAARPKQFREITPIPLLRIHEHAHSTALHPFVGTIAAGRR